MLPSGGKLFPTNYDKLDLQIFIRILHNSQPSVTTQFYILTRYSNTKVDS